MCLTPHIPFPMWRAVASGERKKSGAAAPVAPQPRSTHKVDYAVAFASSSTACAAASLAIGTRNGEHDT
jgi:hypothetical protein